MPDERPLPDTQVPDTQEDFENNSQVNAAETTEAQGIRNINRKRTYDVYQDFDVQAQRSNQRTLDRFEQLAFQAMQNSIETANMVGKQAIRHADVATDALWTDELNPTMHGAEAVMAGQAPVNTQLASTASIDTVFTNLTAQVGELVTAVIGLANSQAAQNLAIAQMLQNSKQNPTGAGA